MLNTIRQMINEKVKFDQEASVICEDVNGNLDDLLVLGETTSYNEEGEMDTNIGGGEDIGDTGEISEDGEEHIEDDIEDNNNSEDILDSPIDTPDSDKPKTDDLLDSNIDGTDGSTEPTSSGPDSILDSPIDGSNISTAEPMTGAPIDDPASQIDEIDNILDTAIDLRSNTIKDSLPIPPSNASESLPDSDIATQNVDSGFGGEDPISPTPMDDPLSAPIDAPAEEPIAPDNQFGESKHILVNEDNSKGYHLEDVPYILYCAACKKKKKKAVSKNEFSTSKKFNSIRSDVYSTISDMIKGDKFTLVSESTIEDIYESKELMAYSEGIVLDDEPDATEEPPADGASPGGENEVTSAVRDKVEEANTEEPEGIDTSGLDDSLATGGDITTSQKEIIKKLSSITKSIEDAKNAVMGAMN